MLKNLELEKNVRKKNSRKITSEIRDGAESDERFATARGGKIEESLLNEVLKICENFWREKYGGKNFSHWKKISMKKIMTNSH